eukprot:XP_001705696.1 Hypothetical protein GL50803_35833 [Giardia lamblia ATCC 50803]
MLCTTLLVATRSFLRLLSTQLQSQLELNVIFIVVVIDVARSHVSKHEGLDIGIDKVIQGIPINMGYGRIYPIAPCSRSIHEVL